MIDEKSLQNIQKLHELHSAGILSDSEFNEAKRKLLNSDPVSEPALGQDVSKASLGRDADAISWMLLPLKRYAQFDGRSGRKEFWMFVLGWLLVAFALSIIIAADTNVFGYTGGIGTLAYGLLMIFALVTLVPTFAVQARRFHDQNRSGWLVLINLIPVVGVFIVFAFMLAEGDPSENQYGPPPT